MSNHTRDTTGRRAAAYEELLSQAAALAENCSGEHWSIKRQHDPGLTILQILANALGLTRERNAALLRSPLLFGRETAGMERWKELPSEPGTPGSGSGGGVAPGAAEPGENGFGLVFQPRQTAPARADFMPTPASRRDIRAAAEAIPGLLKAWLADAPLADAGAAPSRPELLLEFAPVLSLHLPESLDEAGRWRDRAALAAAGPAAGKSVGPQRLRGRKRSLLREASRLLRSTRGLCQPVLSCREAVGAPLALEISLESVFASVVEHGGGLEIYRPEFQDPLAATMLALEKSLRRDESPPTTLSAAALLEEARGQAQGVTGLASCGLRLMALRLAPLFPSGSTQTERGSEEIERAGRRDLPSEASSTKHQDILALPAGFDCFRFEQWRVSLTRGGRRIYLPDDCVRQALFQAERRLLDELWNGRWRTGAAEGEASGPLMGGSPHDLSGPDSSVSPGSIRSSGRAGTAESGTQAEAVTAAEEAGFLYEQFPELYGLKRVVDESSSNAASGRQSGYDPAPALQLHGWLQLFEGMLAEARAPLEGPLRFFSPLAPSASGQASSDSLNEDVFDGAHPLHSKLLAGPGFAPVTALAGEHDAVRSSADPAERPSGQDRFYLERNRALLLHLAALQGEEPWFDHEDMRLEDEFGRSLPADRAERYNRLLSFWLRALPRLNGRRLLRRWSQGGNFLESGGLSPLEERLSMLLLPYQAASVPATARQSEPARAAGAAHTDQRGGCGGANTGAAAQGGPYGFALGPPRLEMRKCRNGLTGRGEYRCYISDGGGRLRIVCTLLSPTPEQAELVAASALRLASLAGHYHLEQGRVRIGWLAELYLPDETPGHCAGACSAPSGGRGLRREVRRAVEWARSVLPPWVSVLDYSELGEARPFELAILAEADLVPPRRRQALEARIRAHVPAHLLPRVFFVSPEQRRRADALLHAPDSVNYESLHTRYSGLLDLLRELEAEADAGDSGGAA